MRRKVSLLLAFVLTLTLMTGAFAIGGNAADTVYFTAVNDQLLELSDATMPFWDKGVLYVAGSAFSGNLGLSYSYNAAKKVLVLSQSGLRLVCNVPSRMIVDSNGVAYKEEPVERSGVVFVPVNVVCRVFSISATTRSVSGGFLVRIRNSSAAFSDEAFVDAAEAMMNTRYAEYEAAHKAPEDIDEGAEDEGGKEFFLALTVKDAAMAAEYLDALAGTEHHATFLLTAAFCETMESKENAAVLRRILGEGHNLAIASSESLADLRAVNERLSRLTYTKTRLYGSVQNAALAQYGYTAVAGNVKTEDLDLKSTAAALRLVSRISGASRLVLGEDMSAAALRAFLRSAGQNTYIGDRFREE